MTLKKRISWLLVFALLLPTLSVFTASAASKSPTSNFFSVVYNESNNPASLPYGAWQVGANTDSVVYLSDVDTWKDYLCTNDQAPFRNAPYNGVEGQGVTLSQTLLYEKGIGMHPAGASNPGYLIIDISKYDCDTLYAAVGVNSSLSNGVWFEIQKPIFGGLLYSTIACSELMTPYNVGEFNVDISGCDKIKLVVTAENGISACGSVWADLCIFKKDANAKKPDLSQSAKTSGIVLSDSANASAVTNASVTLSAETNYTIVYNSALDDKINDFKTNVSVKNGQTSYGINYDYEVDLAHSLQAALAKKGISATVTSDAATPVENEILIGYTSRTESSSFLKYLQDNNKLNAYGAAVIGSKIAVGGWGTVSNVTAVEWLIAQTDLSLTLALGPNSVQTLSHAVSLPTYETAGACAGVSESAYNELLYYYRGTSAAEFIAYTQKLAALGYTEQTGFRNSTASSKQGQTNEYRLFVNPSADIQIYLYYSPDEAATRILAGKASEVRYPTGVDTGTDLTPVSITQMQLDFSTNAGGMCYVVTLKDGSFLIFDSGSTSNANQDHVRLWNLLNQLNVRPDGEILIRGWFLTHEHADHTDVFLKFCNTYGSRVTIEGYYACVVPKTVAYNAKNPAYPFASGKVQKALDQTKGNTKLYMLHTGMRFTLQGVEIELLYTPEDLYPTTLHYFNNASSVFRLTVVNGNQESRVLITGDIFIDACNTLLSRHAASEIKCDILQVAHHGNQGATKAFYTAADPAVTLWPCAKESFDALMNANGKTSYHKIDQYLINSLNVQESYMAGTTVAENANEDSVQLPLPYTLGSYKKLCVPTVDSFPEGFGGVDHTVTLLPSPAYAPVLPFKGTVHYLSDLSFTGTTSNTNGIGPAQNAPYKGEANTGIETLSGATFTKGLGTHPKSPGHASPSYTEIDISALNVNQFYAVLGFTAGGTNSIKGQVWADYGNGFVLLTETPSIGGKDMVEIRITNKLQGVQKLRLVTISTGKTNENSHFAWCNVSVFNAPYMIKNTDYYLHTLKAPTAVPNLPYKSTVTYLSDLDYTGTTSGGSKPAQNAVYKGTANSGITTMGGLTFTKGFGTHPMTPGHADPSYTEIDVSAQTFNRFYTVLARTSDSANGIKGQVWADYGNGYVLLFESDAVRGTDLQEIHIVKGLEGVKKIKLVTLPADASNSTCHTAWCNTLVYHDPNEAIALEGTHYVTNKLPSPTEAPTIPYAGEITYLSDLSFTGTTSSPQGLGPAQNADYKGNANSGIHTKSGLTFQKGFGTHPYAITSTKTAYTEIDVSAYQISGFYAILTRTASAASSADIPVFGQIWVDYDDGMGYQLFLETERITNKDMLEIHVTQSLKGVKRIKLVTVADSNNNSASHSAWCNALIYNAPDFVGTQYKDSETDGAYDARLIFSVDTLAWDSLTVALTHNGKTQNVDISTVYSAIVADYSATGAKADSEISAYDLGNKYVFVVCIQGIPVLLGNVEFDISLTATGKTGQTQTSNHSVTLSH